MVWLRTDTVIRHKGRGIRKKERHWFLCDECGIEFEALAVRKRQQNQYHSPECSAIADRKGRRNKKARIIDGRTLTQYQIAKRHKRCASCDVEYCDVTSRNVGHYCSSECRDKASVATRKAKGSYKRTEEQNAKLSATLRRQYDAGEIGMSDEARLAASLRMSEMWSSGRMKLLAEATCLERYGETHWMRTEQGRAQSREIGKRPKRAETCAAISRSAARRTVYHTRANGGRRLDLGGLYVRSSWEANVARLLNACTFDWEYEPFVVDLQDGSLYRPDFWVAGVLYEVKGYWTSGAHRKFERFRELYPTAAIMVIGPDEYRRLAQHYADVIEHWEK